MHPRRALRKAYNLMHGRHGHHDHLGSAPGDVANADALSIARRTKPAWPCIHEMSLWLERR